MKFRFNRHVYEVPEGIDVEVIHGDHGGGHEYTDFNFVLDGQWGKHIPMLGGTDEDGKSVLSWDDVGIRKIE